MVDIHHSAVVGVPVEVAFDYVTSIHNVPEWLYGVRRVAVVSGVDSGLGAVYEGTIKVGATLRSRIEVTGWEPGRLMTVESRHGFVNRSTWRFESLGPERTQLTADVSYELPAGLAGKALGKAIEPFVSIAVRHSDSRLRRRLTELYGAPTR